LRFFFRLGIVHGGSVRIGAAKAPAHPLVDLAGFREARSGFSDARTREKGAWSWTGVTPHLALPKEYLQKRIKKRNLFEPAGRVISLPVFASTLEGTPKGQRLLRRHASPGPSPHNLHKREQSKVHNNSSIIITVIFHRGTKCSIPFLHYSKASHQQSISARCA
jgi:hypothetical protein